MNNANCSMKQLKHRIKRTYNFISSHPLTRRHVFRSIGRVLYWQLQTTLKPNSEIEKTFIKPVKFYARKRRAGVTGNIYSGLHEFNEMAFVLHFLRSKDVFFDVGANVGVYTLLASGICKATSVALEPIPSTFKLLSRNIELNNLQYKVTLINAAAGDEPGILIFSSAQDTTNHVIRPNETATNTIEVEVIKIDSLVQYNPVLIKIDVEGFESRVLIGAENILKSIALKAIIIELSNTVEYGFDDTYTHHILTLNGFKPFSYDPFTRKLSSITELLSDNIIYCRDLNFARSRVKNADSIKIMGEKI